MTESRDHRHIIGAQHAPYRAITLRPSQAGSSPLWVERTKILETLNRPPIIGVLACVTGPLGSGKTVLAMQWAENHGGPIQYLSARISPDIPSEWIDDPDELGLALEELLNSCSRFVPEPSEKHIQANLDRVISLAEHSNQCIILDDAELFSLAAFGILRTKLKQALRRISTERILVISRTMDSGSLGHFQSLGGFRLVLPSTMEFDVQETIQAHQLGVFGDSSLKQIQAAREESNGWITGMHLALAQSEERFNQLQARILNEMLFQVVSPILHVMITAALVPWNTSELWSRWFNHFGLPNLAIPATLSQLPTRMIDHQSQRFEIVPMMRAALSNLRPIAAQSGVVEHLLSISLSWYISHGEMGAAMSLARNHQLESQFLKAIKPLCSDHAHVENWPAIVELIDHIPDEVLIQDPEITFWAFHGWVELGLTERMNRLFDRVRDDWEKSSDPLVRGRLYLALSWGANMRSQAADAIRHSNNAWDILPQSAHRERLWAAGTAANAEAFLADSEKSHQWMARTSPLFPLLPKSMRWWHNIAGTMRLSFHAISGRLTEAYDTAQWQIDNLSEQYASLTTRYHVLKAQIDIERLRFDAAEDALGKAKALAVDSYDQPVWVRAGEAILAHARGDIDEAWDILSVDRAYPRPRLDLANRAANLIAQFAFETGDIEAAKYHLGSRLPLHDPWPKYFGDVHPKLLIALILHAQGRSDEAAAKAASVANEALRRGHRYFAIRAYSTLAYIFQREDDKQRMQSAINSAIGVSRTSGFQLAFIIMGQDVRDFASLSEPMDSDNVPSSDIAQPWKSELTRRELEVIALAAQSLPNKQIADQMYISVSTVKNHLAKAYDKLGTNNRRDAVRIARNLGLINDWMAEHQKK